MPDDDANLITQTPLALHPQNFTTVHADHQADPVVSSLREAVSLAHASWQSTLVAHKKIMADPTRTEIDNMSRSAKAAARRQDEALRTLDRAADRARLEVEMISQAVTKVPDPPAPHVTRMVAEALRGMTPEQRREAVADALKARDMGVLGAVCFVGPAFAYGMTRAERDMVVHQFQYAAYPTAMARRAALERSVELVTKAGSALMAAHGKMFDHARLQAAQALADEAQAALGD